MNERRTDIISAISILALVFIGFYQTSLIDLTLSSELEKFTGPRAYPRIILSGMLFLVFIQLGMIWIARNKEVAADIAPPVHPRLTKVFLSLLTLTLFTAAFEPLGYIITMIPLLVIIGYLNGANNPWKIIVFAVVASATCLVVFRYGLNTVLPEGLLGIDQIF